MDRPTADRATADRAAADRVAADRSDADRPCDRAAADRVAVDRAAADGACITALQAGLELERRTVARLLAQDRQRSEHIAGVCHDLRTPLTSILGHLEVIADEPDLTQAAGSLATIQRNAARLLALVELLLPAPAADGDQPGPGNRARPGPEERLAHAPEPARPHAPQAAG